MLFNRKIQQNLFRLSKQYPVIVITGPRQSGKTTLVKTSFPDRPYINLENPENRRFAIEDPLGFLKSYKGGLIDEFQRAPELTSYILEMTDEDPMDGMFILTGSQQFEVMKNVSQSLAGRAAILKLLPLNLSEIGEHKPFQDINDLILKGCYPGLHQKSLVPSEAYAFYFQTYLERDLRLMLNVQDLSLFEKFVKLCAYRNGQILNLTELGNDAGVTAKTAGKWISILEESYIVHLLRPHYKNLGKRLIKSPKLYFIDTGLACFLSGISTTNEVAHHSLRGPLFESLIFSELLKARYNAVLPANVYYWRDNSGHEIDFILETALSQIPLEVKSGGTINSDYFKNLMFYKKINKDCGQAFLLYAGDKTRKQSGVLVVNVRTIEMLLSQISGTD